jgi:4-amino-4-deoxy-L-arabinose transferase-like glycosyltransferase
LTSSSLFGPIAFLEKKNRPIIVILIALFILAGGIYSFYLGNDFRFLPDEANYFNLATNLAFKGEYSLNGAQLTTYRPPGYPFFLAPFRRIGFNIVGLRILNYFTLGLAIYVLYKLLEKRFAPLAGLLGAILVMAYPVVFYTAGTLYPQTFASLLLVLTIYFYAREPARKWDNILAGLLAGWLILTAPTFIFILAILVGWSWIYQQNRKSLQILLTLVAACLVVGMWSLRNFAVFHTFVFVTSNSGVNLLIGNSENTTPDGDWGIVDISSYELQAAGLDEIQQDHFYRDQAIHYILTHKIASLKMYFLKFLNFFNYRNEFVTKSETSKAREFLILMTYGPLLLAAIARLIFSKTYNLSPFEILLVSAYLADALVSAVFVTRIRYRIPFDYMLIMIVAIFINRLINDRLSYNPNY